MTLSLSASGTCSLMGRKARTEELEVGGPPLGLEWITRGHLHWTMLSDMLPMILPAQSGGKDDHLKLNVNL